MTDQYAQEKPDDLVDQFGQFYRRYYSDEIGELAQNYPNDQRWLHVDFSDLYQYDSGLADDLLSNGEKIREYAEEALRLYDLPVDVSLGRADFRPRNIPPKNTFDVGEYRARHLGHLLAIEGEIISCSEVEPKAEEAAFECPLCGTFTYIPQNGWDLQEPHECQGCEREKPGFQMNMNQSELVDYRMVTLEATESNLSDPPTLTAHITKDLVDRVGPGDHVTAIGVFNATSPSGQDKSAVLDTFVNVWDIERDREAEADKLDASDLRKKIILYVQDHQNDGTGFGVEQERVVEHIAEENATREQEVEDAIEDLLDDNEVNEVGGNLVVT